jgi:HSP20 family protein
MATLVRWDPFREVAALHNDLSRMLSNVLEGDGRSGQSWVPSLDAWETEKELVYAFDLPGVDPDKIDVELENDTLTVKAERERTHEVKEERFYRFERRFGTFSRSIGLPQGVAEGDVKADYRDGVLEIRVPKPEETKPRRIQIGKPETATIEGSATTK